MKRYFCYLLAATVLLAGGFAARADQASPESRLRDALKTTLLQLRTVTAKADDLQAQVDDLKTQNDQLTKKLAELTKQAATDQDTYTKTLTELKTRASDQAGSIASLQAALSKSQDETHTAATLASETEAKRAKLADLAIRFQRIVDDQKRKNGEMYKIGMEVIDRYEKYGLGQALAAKEPFVGISRAKFQTLVQDYEDKLTDQRITDQKAPDQKPKQ